MNYRALILTYYWPPAGGVAVQRFLKFTKYLRCFGVEPIIITVKDGSYAYVDDSLMAQIPENVQVYRTATFEPFALYNLLRGKKGKEVPIAVAAASNKSFFQRIAEFIRANFFVPDARKGWVPFAVAQCEKIIREQPIECIITTGPPHSTHLAGLQLKKKHGLRWVADFRDPWTEIFNNQYLPITNWARKRDKKLEAEVLAHCDVATMIGEGMKAVFPEQYRHKMQVITNGYDEEDFTGIVAPLLDKFRLCYIGNLLANQNVPALWQALAELREQHASFRAKFELAITGKADALIRENLTQFNLLGCTKFQGFVTHADAILQMRQAGVLLSVIPQVANNELIVTGKIFEYIGSGRPIILLAPHICDAKSVLQQAAAGQAFHYSEKERIKAYLLSLFEMYEHHEPNSLPTKRLAFSRKYLTGKLAALVIQN